MAVFQSVADNGSFRAAAKQLGVSPSVISHHVSQLEAQLGLALIYRSTRRISLTDAGEELLDSARRMTHAADAGMDAMQRRRDAPTGTLRVTAPTGAQHPVYSEQFISFARKYPGIRFLMEYRDAFVDLEGSNYDVAIRGVLGTSLEDSSYKTRLRGRYPIWLVASVDYAAERPVPRILGDLIDWTMIGHPPDMMLDRLPIDPADRPGAMPKIGFETNSMSAAEEAMLQGLGFMLGPVDVLRPHVEAGRAVRLCADIPIHPINTYLIWPANAGENSLVRLFLDHMRDAPPSRAVP